MGFNRKWDKLSASCRKSMQIGRLALCPKQFLQKSVDDKKRLSTSGGWSLQEQPQLLGREKRSSFWVNFEHVRWGGVSFVQDGSQEACSLIGGMVQTNGTRICEIKILEYMRVSSKKLNNHTRCQNLWRAAYWDLPMLYMHLGSGCDLNFEDIC